MSFPTSVLPAEFTPQLPTMVSRTAWPLLSTFLTVIQRFSPTQMNQGPQLAMGKPSRRQSPNLLVLQPGMPTWFLGPSRRCTEL